MEFVLAFTTSATVVLGFCIAALVSEIRELRARVDFLHRSHRSLVLSVMRAQKIDAQFATQQRLDMQA